MLKILIVRDEGSKQHDLTTLETRFQEQAKFRRAGDLDTALDYLDRGDVSCILLACALKDIDGRDIYKTLRQKHPQVPLGLLIKEDGQTRVLDMDGGMSFHVYDGLSDAEVFSRIVSTVERFNPRVSLPTVASQGRVGPDVTTKPPRHPLPPVDIVEAVATRDTLPEATLDLHSRLREVEMLVQANARDLRFIAWVLAIIVVLRITSMLLP